MANRGRKRRKEALAPAGRTGRVSDDRTVLARRALRMVIICALFLAALYANGIPAGKGPDETAHLRYVQWLAEHHRLPIFDRESPGMDYEFHQPPLYYLLCLPTYLLASRHSEAAGQTLRFVTILLSLVLIYLAFALARTLVPDRPWAAPAAAAVVAFLPMHLSLSASVGNDALTEVLFAAALLMMIRSLRAASLYRARQTERQPTATPMIGAGVFIGLGLLTKSLAVLLLPAVWLTAGLAARGPASYQWRRLLRDGAWATGLALLIAGWWLIRNQLLYGDLLAQKAFLTAFQDRPSPDDFMRRTGLTVAEYVSLATMWSAASVTGVFGPVFANRFVFFPFWVYIGTGLVGVVGMAGFLRYLRTADLSDWQRQSWAICGLLGVLLLASFIRFNFSFFQAQARYLFPVLPPAALAFCVGLEQVVPARWRHGALLAAPALLALLSLIALPLWITPQFRSP